MKSKTIAVIKTVALSLLSSTAMAGPIESSLQKSLSAGAVILLDKRQTHRDVIKTCLFNFDLMLDGKLLKRKILIAEAARALDASMARQTETIQSDGDIYRVGFFNYSAEHFNSQPIEIASVSNKLEGSLRGGYSSGEFLPSGVDQIVMGIKIQRSTVCED